MVYHKQYPCCHAAKLILFLTFNETGYTIFMTVYLPLVYDCKLVALVIYNLIQRLGLINHEPIRKSTKWNRYFGWYVMWNMCLVLIYLLYKMGHKSCTNLVHILNNYIEKVFKKSNLVISYYRIHWLKQFAIGIYLNLFTNEGNLRNKRKIMVYSYFPLQLSFHLWV